MSTSARASASAAESPSAPASAFVRSPPSSANGDADGVDECLQVGGNYFSCGGAYDRETDPVAKRYLWRIAQGHAAGVSDYGKKGPPADLGSMPHAEVPLGCDPSKPCGYKKEGSMVTNDALSCLALAFAQAGADPAAARAAHTQACKCDAKGGNFPGYNRSAFICDDKGKPTFIAPSMKADEAKDILDCAVCHPKHGPAACQREVTRLKTSDAALSEYVATKHLRRCRTPNKGVITWDEWH